ncbi:hypothetical protein ZOSMA_114G00620 [Zostera marina]|uniref:Uncharacterized protein n=1 Tax=Zostera marina TaxID=29655 RepID=A0A0K9Q4S3_ZOSMR|nr:hypothetical protein ZOSMA_114G00620 [Zostera marina]
MRQRSEGEQSRSIHCSVPWRKEKNLSQLPILRSVLALDSPLQIRYNQNRSP